MKKRAGSMFRRLLSVLMTAVLLSSVMPDALTAVITAGAERVSANGDEDKVVYTINAGDGKFPRKPLAEEDSAYTAHYYYSEMEIELEKGLTVGQIKAAIRDMLKIPEGADDMYYAFREGYVADTVNIVTEFKGLDDETVYQPGNNHELNIEWIEGGEVSLTLKLNGGEIKLWPGNPDMENISRSGDTYIISGKDHSKLSFPIAEQKGKRHLGWKRVGGDDTDFVSAKQDYTWIICDAVYEAVWEELPAHTLRLNVDISGMLPDYIKDGITFYEGDNMSDIFTREQLDELNHLSYTVDDVRYQVVDWTSRWTLEYYPLCYETSDLTITPVYMKTLYRIDHASFTLFPPIAGKSMLNAGSGLMEDRYDGLEAYCDDEVYKDAALTEKLKNSEAFEAGESYYAIIELEEDLDHFIDENKLPTLMINGEKTEILQDEDGLYCVWSFEPAESLPSFTVTLDHNLGDGTLIHRISGIPAGTEFWQRNDGEFSLAEALQLEETAGEGIDYEAYKALKTEYNSGKDAFRKKYKKTEAVKTGYRSSGIFTLEKNCKSYRERKKYSGFDSVRADFTLYEQWDRELESITVEDIISPVCGVGSRTYSANYPITMESGTECRVATTVTSTDSTESPDILMGGTEYYLRIDWVRVVGPDHKEYKDEFFDAYAGENTRLIYKGKEYSASAEGRNLYYYIPVTAVHKIPEEAEIQIRNRVEAKCDKPGSYDEVYCYECEYCHEQTEDIKPVVINAPGHKWGAWKVTKEATDTEEGEEERICENDPSHKEVRKIPPKNAAEEQEEEEKKEEEKKEDEKKPAVKTAVTVSANDTAKLNDSEIKVETVITYPKAVSWTGRKITKEQLAVLSEEGVIARVKISGLDKAISGLKADADISKLLTPSYVIDKKNKVGEKGSFYVKLKLNSKTAKKAGIRGKNKKALEKCIKEINKSLKDKPCSFDIVPVELKDTSVTIKAKLKGGELQLNEDGSLKGLKAVKVKVNIPGLKKPKTYSYTAKKAQKIFKINVTDAAGKKASVEALPDQNFSGSISDVSISK